MKKDDSTFDAELTGVDSVFLKLSSSESLEINESESSLLLPDKMTLL